MLSNLSLRFKLLLVLFFVLTSCFILAYTTLQAINNLSTKSSHVIEITQQLKQIQNLQVSLIDFDRTKNSVVGDQLQNRLKALEVHADQAIQIFENLASQQDLPDHMNFTLNYHQYINVQRNLIQIQQEIGTSPNEGNRLLLSYAGKELEHKLFGPLSPLYTELNSEINRSFIINNEQQYKSINNQLSLLKNKMDNLGLTDRYRKELGHFEKQLSITLNLLNSELDKKELSQQYLSDLKNKTTVLSRYIDRTILSKTKNTMLRAVEQSKKVVIIGSTVLAIILFILLFNIARTITSSLIKANKCLENIGEGKLSHRLPVNQKKNDEFDHLAISINTMADDLESIVGEIMRNSSEIGHASNILHRSIEQVDQSTQEITKQSTSVAAATEQMSVTLQSIANITTEAYKAAEASCSTTLQGGKIIRSAANSLSETASFFNQVGLDVRELDARSAKVEKITDMINEIANQTNLLALNAAIEAARAGDAGRGFSVVADEVRSLASRTMAATSDISEIIDEMKTQTIALLETMQEGQQCVSKGQRHGESALNVIETIDEKIKGVAADNEQIAIGIQKMSQTTLGITENMETIATAMVESKQHMTEISTGSQLVARKGNALTSAGEKFQSQV